MADPATGSPSSDGDGAADLPVLIAGPTTSRCWGSTSVLGVTVLHLPQDDNGYYISDDEDVDPVFGTLADVDRPVADRTSVGWKGSATDLVV